MIQPLSCGLLAGLALFLVAPRDVPAEEMLHGHPVRLDREGKLLSWVDPQERAYDRVVRLAWEYLLAGQPTEDNGLPTSLTYCCFDGQTRRGTRWPHNPACFNAGIVEGAAAFHAYSGDRRVIDFVRRQLDHQLEHGTTPAHWPWASVPYASADPGSRLYRGAHDFLYDKVPGRGDGYGVIEPDKVAELGVAYLKAWKLTGDVRYRDAALAGARALASHVRRGDERHSPWPFRIYAETDVVREEYCAHTAAALRLFDGLQRLGLGSTSEWARARAVAWEWLQSVPMRTNAWANYFEDLPVIDGLTNLNQYSPMETARYLLENPERDPEWRSHSKALIDWVEGFFGRDTEKEKGRQWGAVAISEQVEYMYKMGSHTSRFASVLALRHEKTGEQEAKEKAFRSLNWATYMCDPDGLVGVGPVEPSHWFTDGYGDYIRHLHAAMGAVPEWAPPGEDHLLRSSSVVTEVSYGPGRVAYGTFDDGGLEVLRLSFRPTRVVAGGRELAPRPGLIEPGFMFDPATGVLRVRRAGARRVEIAGSPVAR